MIHRTVVLMPGRCGGQPTVGESRLPAVQVAEMWWSGGWTLESLLSNWSPYNYYDGTPDSPHWPGLDRSNVLVACWYVARYGTRTWRKRWGPWLHAHETELWSGEYDTCPLPPQSGEG